LSLNWALAGSLVATGVLLLVYSGRTRISGWWIALAVALNVSLLVAWTVGWSQWCSSCGAP
jgi:hypothetical protein